MAPFLSLHDSDTGTVIAIGFQRTEANSPLCSQNKTYNFLGCYADKGHLFIFANIKEAVLTHLPNIIDIEASGFGNGSYPIEIGVVDHHGNRFCTLISPDQSWTHWDKSAENVHHISRQNLAESGRNLKDVAQILNNFYQGQILYSDGWVVDKPWINTLFQAAKLKMEFSVSPLEMILNERQMELWHAEKERVINELKLARHRASNDAKIIQETYKRTRQLACLNAVV